MADFFLLHSIQPVHYREKRVSAVRELPHVALRHF